MIRFDDVHSIKAIAKAARIQFIPILHHCIAQYSRDDKLLGGVLFTDYWGGSVMMHQALFSGMAGMRPLIWLVFQYPFVQLGVKKVFGMVPEWNYQARNLNLHLGFKIEYLTADVFNHAEGPNGMYLMSMRKEDCRWLNMKMPYIEYAPPERTNQIDLPLAAMSAVGMMQ
jgi:hypothetical protein